MDAFLLRGLRTIQQGLHDNSWAKLYQRKKQKGLTDDAASISAARLALFWCHSVGFNKQILRKVYREWRWKIVGRDESRQWAPRITAGCRLCCNWLRAKEVWYGSSCLQPLLEARLNHLAPESLELYLERNPATESTLGVMLCARLETNDRLAETGSLAGPDLVWHVTSGMSSPKHPKTMEARNNEEVQEGDLQFLIRAWGATWERRGTGKGKRLVVS